MKTAKPSPKQDEGSVCARWVRCGRSWCRCMNDGPKHGPFYTQTWWQGGRRYKRYVRKQDAPQIAAACAERRESERAARELAEARHEEWRIVRELIRGFERGHD